MSIGERIKELIDFEKRRGVTFSKKIKVSGSTVSTIKRGVSKPGFEFLQAVCKAYPNLNWRWFLIGEGDMFTPKEYPQVDFESRLQKLEDEFQEYKRRFDVE